MEPEEYRRLYDVEEDHGYFKARQAIISQLLNKFCSTNGGNVKILDAGCGTGGMLNFLSAYGRPIGVDISDIALSFCKRRESQILQASISNLPFKDETFDIIISLGVLYHKKVTSDLEAMRELYRVAKRNGRVIVTNPAYNFLLSGHDAATHAKKRYTLKGLEGIIKNSGFTILKATYYTMFLFPILLFTSILGNITRGRDRPHSYMRPLPLALNTMVKVVLLIESYLMVKIRLPFGYFVLCVGAK